MRSYGAIDLQTMRAIGARFQTRRPLAELRRPRGLPLPFVEMHVPISPSALEIGAPWPPTQGWSRVHRLTDQWQASRGDYSRWLSEYMPDLPFNPIGAYIDDVRAIMMASHPAEEAEVKLRRGIRRSIGAGTADLIRHGKALFVGYSGYVQALPIRHAWPLADDAGWAVVIPLVTGRTRSSGDGTFDAVDVWILSDGQVSGYQAELEADSGAQSYGTIGNVIAEYVTESAIWADCDRPYVEYMWGKSHVDDLVPIAVAMARRESGMDFAIDRHEVPIYEVSIASADSGVGWDPALGTTSNTTLTNEQFRDMAPSLNEHDVTILTDGRRNGKYVQASLNTQDSLAFFDRLKERWSEQTGQMPTEAGDSGNAESGVAFARRQVRLVARSRELHEAQYDALTEIVGDFEWPYVGTMLGADTSADPAIPVEGEIEDDPDGD